MVANENNFKTSPEVKIIRLVQERNVQELKKFADILVSTVVTVIFLEATKVDNSSNRKSPFELPLVHTCAHTQSVT